MPSGVGTKKVASAGSSSAANAAAVLEVMKRPIGTAHETNRRRECCEQLPGRTAVRSSNEEAVTRWPGGAPRDRTTSKAA
eukprot:CAMPEP_0181225968 /NCGR_PEP_ID=MMETSP1096-20121128/31996_1 /TAXON_ID=156174 ORGANISM="Chrysochromulina ericina, Strain CCMP281" /NCGR_SAMPLE_ID=MMETSP1096 /ASSEMBLY_ACC=CAM_ASM_000453 /LENGTH=79 /DNA_ID=CAMNT_0023319259 /DNA_START=521 /DNA_END=757 /DNA_ORIENTATION=+